MRHHAVYFALILSICTRQYAQSANILGVFPLPGKSVNFLYQKLLQGLANAGHKVVSVSAYEYELTIANGSVQDVLLAGFAKEYDSMISEIDLEKDGVESSNLFQNNVYLAMAVDLYNRTFHHKNVQKLLKSKPKFDLVITDYFWSDSLLRFAQFFKCPSVVFSRVNALVNDMVGNPLPPSYVPHTFLLGDFSKGLGFLERFYNLIFYAYDVIFRHFYSFPAHEKILKSVFKNVKPNVSGLYHNVSLVLLGSHSSVSRAIPLVPNVIEIGGFHIDPPEELPRELQSYLDKSTNGVIYFSMGTVVESRKFSDAKKEMFLNIFRKLNMTVIWKYEDESLPNKPPNVLIGKWLPQMEILSHPNTKLFITHGGYGSTLETVYTGVPALMIPLFFDQFANAYQAQEQGFALKLSYNDKDFNEETLYALIRELLDNPKYAENAKAKSKLFHDRPLKPMETAVYWIEYVIRHKGADHLRVGAVKLPLYQLYMLDVILFLALAGSSITLTLYVLLCRKPLLRKKVKRH